MGCTEDGECPSTLACINGNCKNPCLEGKPCGTNAECRVLDTLPVRTMICECLPGYRGDAAVICKLRKFPKKSYGANVQSMWMTFFPNSNSSILPRRERIRRGRVWKLHLPAWEADCGRSMRKATTSSRMRPQQRLPKYDNYEILKVLSS